MVPDSDTQTVFISQLLHVRYPGVAKELRSVLAGQLKIISEAKDIWCRDYMPIQLDMNRYVQFRYDPDYLRCDPQLRTQNGFALLNLTNCIQSDLVIDGGNIVRWNNTAIVTDKIYQENKGLSQRQLRAELKRTLEIDRLVIIPSEKGDKIGHSDGMVRFIDNQKVLVNDYSAVDPHLGAKLASILKHAGFEVIRFPYMPSNEAGSDPEIASAVGVYINYLQVKKMIICPVFGLPEDDMAIKILKKHFPCQKIIPMLCRELAEEGGVLNCITWNIKTVKRTGRIS